MRYPWFLAVVLAWPVNAADFRVLDFRSSCGPVRSLEEAQGSVPIPWKNIQDRDLMAFRGKAFDRDVSIVYLCIQDELFAGHYFLPIEDFDAVLKSFGEVHEALVADYGRPFLDTSPWSNLTEPDRDPRAVQPDPAKYLATWSTPRIRISLTLMPRVSGGSSDWQVFVMVSANKS